MDLSLLVTWAVSFVALFFSIWSFYRTKRFQDIDYAPRLQIEEQKIVMGNIRIWEENKRQGKAGPPALTYSASIQNKGPKTIWIKGVDLNFGANDPDSRKKTHMGIDGNFYLLPAESRDVHGKLGWEDIQRACERYSTEICHFFLEVEYESPEGKGNVEKTIRHFGGLGKDGETFFDIWRVRKGHTTHPKAPSS